MPLRRCMTRLPSAFRNPGGGGKTLSEYERERIGREKVTLRSRPVSSLCLFGMWLAPLSQSHNGQYGLHCRFVERTVRCHFPQPNQSNPVRCKQIRIRTEADSTFLAYFWLNLIWSNLKSKFDLIRKYDLCISDYLTMCPIVNHHRVHFSQLLSFSIFLFRFIGQ